MQKKHLIFGSGLIGSYLAGCFHLQKNLVYLFGRDSSKAAFSNGFILSDLDNNSYQSNDQLQFAELEKSQTFDVIWLTVKCTSLDSVIAPLRSFVKPSSIIICCQNGFGSEQVIKNAFVNNTVLSAVVGFNVVLDKTNDKENHWHRSTDGTFVIQASHDTRDFDKYLQSKLLPIRLSDDIEAERWAKLQLNLANAVNALADVPIKQMLENRNYRLIIAQLMRELLSVTNALNLDLPKVSAVHGKHIPTIMSLPNFIFKRLAQKMLAIDPQARTSMWQDLNDERLTEIDFINGAISNNAKKFKLRTPYNDAITSLIKSVECGEETIGLTADQLKAKLNI